MANTNGQRDADRQRFQEKNIQLEEKALERKAKELEKAARKLADEVDRTGLGADLQPVPEPTVRDLSVPQARNGKSIRDKTKMEPAEPPAEIEGEVISATEIAAASTTDILGKSQTEKVHQTSSGRMKKPRGEAAALSSASVPAKPRVLTKKNKPITVASTPLIGNYQFPDSPASCSGHQHQADRIEGRADGQRAADAADARAVRHRSRARRHHQRARRSRATNCIRRPA